MNPKRMLFAVVGVWAVVVASGCTTVLKPVRPSTPLTAEGSAVAGVRFDGEQTRIREPGVPVSPSSLWQREVANYTAASLNRALSTSDDAGAAATTVTFDLAAPPLIPLGPYQEMKMSLSSTLPDGRVVRSEAVTGHIDAWSERLVTGGLAVTGIAIDVFSVAAVLYFITTTSDLGGIVLLATLASNLVINLARGAADQIVVVSQEKRWSDLYAEALRKHARDVRQGLGPPSSSVSSTKPSAVPGVPMDPSDAATPPPLLTPGPS
jgi:hypothetical protein